MKPVIETSDGILGGKQVTFEIDFEKDGLQGNYSIDALGFRKGSVEIFAGAGVPGMTLPIKQRNTVQGKGYELAVPESIQTIEGDSEGVFDFEFTGRYVFLDFTGVTVPEEGKMTIIFVVKV